MWCLGKTRLMFKVMKYGGNRKGLNFVLCDSHFFKAWDQISFWASVKDLLNIRSGTMNSWWTTQSRLWQQRPHTCEWAGPPLKDTLPTLEGAKNGVEMVLEMTSSPMDSMAFTSGQVSPIYSHSVVGGDLLPSAFPEAFGAASIKGICYSEM